MTISKLLRKSAENYPNKPAIYFEDEVISYQQLDADVDRVASFFGKTACRYRKVLPSCCQTARSSSPDILLFSGVVEPPL